MRINIYAEELVDRVEVISKSPDNHPNESFKGVRMYLASPDVLHNDPSDDDSSAVTIWVPWAKAGGHKPEVVTSLLRSMADALEVEYGITPERDLYRETLKRFTSHFRRQQAPNPEMRDAIKVANALLRGKR